MLLGLYLHKPGWMSIHHGQFEPGGGIFYDLKEGVELLRRLS
jgi:hypothetical protein